MLAAASGRLHTAAGPWAKISFVGDRRELSWGHERVLGVSERGVDVGDQRQRRRWCRGGAHHGLQCVQCGQLAVETGRPDRSIDELIDGLTDPSPTARPYTQHTQARPLWCGRRPRPEPYTPTTPSSAVPDPRLRSIGAVTWLLCKNPAFAAALGEDALPMSTLAGRLHHHLFTEGDSRPLDVAAINESGGVVNSPRWPGFSGMERMVHASAQRCRGSIG